MRIAPYLRLLLALVTKVRNWPVYFQNRYFTLRRKRIVYNMRCGIVIRSRPFAIDGSALNDVWLDESYDPNHFGVPFDWGSCKNILDIGANIGTFTLFALWKAPAAHIIAVEPEPGNAGIWRENVAANHLEHRAQLQEAGIAEREGVATLHVSHKNSGGHSLSKYSEDSHPITVKLMTLQSIFDRLSIDRCDFLKLDCEGGEYDGLYGLRSETLHTIRFMAIECHLFSQNPRHTPAQLKAFLESHGFTVTTPKKSVFFARRP